MADHSQNAGTIVILAIDDGLHLALSLALEIMNYNTVRGRALAAVPFEALRDNACILVDCSLITPAGAAVLSKLREDGWPGVLVVMAEDEAGCGIVSEEKYQAIVLTKPFGLDELIAAIAWNPHANSSLYFALSTPQVAE